MRDRIAITILIFTYLVLATTYSLVTPLGEGPDEPGHAKYVFFLAREWQLPVQCAPPCENTVPGEGHQPPLAYLLATSTLLWLPQAERSFDLPGNRAFMWVGGSSVNAVAHGSREYWPWHGEVLAWHLARMLYVVLGSVALLLTFFTGRQLFGTAVGLVATLVMAFNPQFLFTAGLINNDTLLTMLCALLLWLTTKQPQPTSSMFGRAFAIGIVLGLALITKQSALLLVPIVGLWCVLVQSGVIRSRWPSAINAQALIRIAVAYGVAGLISGWWYIRNAVLYGDPLGLAAFKAEFMTQKFDAGRIDAWVSALATLHESFWSRFGWMNVYAPNWAIWVYTAVEVAAFVGIIHRLLQWKDYGQLAARIWPVILLPVLAFAWLVSFAFTAGLVAWQGRLLFPALPAVAIGLAYGLVALVRWQPRGVKSAEARQAEIPKVVAYLGLQPGQRGAWSIACAGYVLLAGIALWMPFGIIRPAYPFQTIPETEALSQIATPVYARYAARADERGTALRSVAVLGNICPNETIQVQLIWNALGRQNRDWWVFMHLVDDRENILSEDNRQARDGAFPMTQWIAGDWIESKHPLVLPANIQPGTYRLRIGLWFPETERRAGYFDAGEKLLGDYLEIPLVVTK